MGLRIVLRAALVAAFLASAGVPAIASGRGGPSPHHRPVADRITGTIRVNGCRVRPSQIELAAFPLQPELEREAVAPIDRRAITRRALVLPTGDPRVFRFRISGLRPEVSYRLRIGLPPNPCGRIFWRGPLGGMAAGGQRRLLIEGFVATSELEVLDAAAGRWVGMDHLAFGDPRAGTRSFRWRSSVPRDTGGELQVSTAPFPIGADGCSEPDEGILLRRDVPRSAGRWTQTGPVDFNDLLLPVRGRAGTGQNGPRTTAVTDATVAQLSAGAPLYVRVVPRTRSGLACDTKRQGVGGWVVMAQLPDGPPPPVIEPPSQPALEAGNDHSYEPPYLDFWSDGAIHPQYHEEAFLVIKDHVMPSKLWCQYGNDLFSQTDPPGSVLDSYGCMLVFANALAPGAVLKAGDRFKYFQTTTSSGGGGPLGFLEDFTNALGNVVTGAISAAGWAVDSLSKLYEDAKKAVAQVVKAVITVVPGLGQLCSAHPAQCEAAIQTGITTGLAAIGLPPSIPNWDAVKQQGVDYLAAEVASQTGAPPEVVDLAVEVAQEAIEEMTAKRGLLPQPGYDWLIPYLGTNPAVLTVDIRKNDPNPLPSLFLLRPASVPFVGGTPRIPRVFVTDPTHLRMPMVLRPNLSGIPAPLCTFPLGGPITCVPNAFNPLTAACRYHVSGPGGLVFEFLPCPEKVLGIYYRSEWIPKLATGCTTLASAALSPVLETVLVDTPIGPLPKYQLVWKAVPGYSFVVLGQVQPPVPFSWSGPFGSDCNP